MLSKETKHLIYRKAMALMIERISSRLPCLGLCFNITNAAIEITGSTDFDGHSINMPIYYPEVFKHKPAIVTGAWWFPMDEGGIKKRLDILDKAIKETQ